MKFEGIYTPVITPFKKDFSIDRTGYAQVIEAQIGLGIHGLVIGGTTGENYALTPEERIWQFEFAHKVIKGRVPWLAGVNDIRTESVCAYAVAARKAGADALLLAVPPYSCPTGSELAQHALEVQRAGKLPVMLYNYPARSGAEMNHEFLKTIHGKPGFFGIKESSGNIDRVHMLAQEFPKLQLCCGADDQALEFFAWGARSWICAAANFLAPETIALHRACAVEGNFALGRRIMMAMMPVMTVLERGGKFVQCVKFGCEIDGLPAGGVRLPLRPMSQELKQEFRTTLLTARKAVKALVSGK